MNNEAKSITKINRIIFCLFFIILVIRNDFFKCMVIAVYSVSTAKVRFFFDICKKKATFLKKLAFLDRPKG